MRSTGVTSEGVLATEATEKIELAPPGSPPTVAVVPELLLGEHVAVREDDDTDADYEARSRLLAAVLLAAKIA